MLRFDNLRWFINMSDQMYLLNLHPEFKLNSLLPCTLVARPGNTIHAPQRLIIAKCYLMAKRDYVFKRNISCL